VLEAANCEQALLPTEPRGDVGVVDRAAFAVGVAVGLVILLAAGMPVAQVLRSALGISDKAQGLDKLISALHALELPFTVAAVAIAPLGLIAGGVALMIGNRHAMRILGGTVGGLIVVGLCDVIVE
jgi:hypothetical protein